MVPPPFLIFISSCQAAHLLILAVEGRVDAPLVEFGAYYWTVISSRQRQSCRCSKTLWWCEGARASFGTAVAFVKGLPRVAGAVTGVGAAKIRLLRRLLYNYSLLAASSSGTTCMC